MQNLYGVVSVRTRFSGWLNCWRNVRLMGQSYDGYGFVMLDFMLRLAVAYRVVILKFDFQC